MLTTDLDGEDEKDKGALDNLLAQLIAELGMDKKVRWGGRAQVLLLTGASSGF